MKLRSHLGAIPALLIGMAVVPLHAQTFTFNNGGTDGLWSTPANWTGSLTSPNSAGALAVMNTGGAFVTELDEDATVGGLRNTAGSARIWTHTNTGGITLTLDGTGLTNGFGNVDTAEIRATSSGGIISAANLSLSNTDLDIGTIGSNNSNAQITLSGAITATTNQTITVRNNRRQTNLQGDIGASGAGEITILNLSHSTTGIGDPNQLNISGNLGSQVVQLTQGTGVTTGMVISGANADFTGDVAVLANSITVGASATLGNFNTVTVADGASLILQNANALGSASSLLLDDLGTATLSFSGTLMIGALSFDGGSLFAPGGSIWGALGSGAMFESDQLLGAGFLEVAVIPEPSSFALLLGAGALGLALRRRRVGLRRNDAI